MPKAERILHIAASIITIISGMVALVSWLWVVHDDPEIVNSQSYVSWVKQALFTVSYSFRVVIAFLFQIISSYYLSRFFSLKWIGKEVSRLLIGIVMTGFASFISLAILQSSGFGVLFFALVMAFIVTITFSVATTEEDDGIGASFGIGSFIMMMILYFTSG